MQNDELKYSYLPLITSESQYPYTPVHQQQQQPQVHQYQPAQYPSFNQPPPQQFVQPQPQFIQPVFPEAQMKYQHLTTRCVVHQFPLDTICRAPECTNRLLCNLCAAEHASHFCGHKDTFTPLMDLLDDSIIAELESLATEEQQCTERVNNRCQQPAAPATIKAFFEKLRIKMNDALDWTEEQAKKRAKERALLKLKFGWGNLRNEYVMKKRMFLSAKPGCQTWELLQLIDIMNRIKTKQGELESEIQKKLKSRKNKINKFVVKMKEKGLKIKEKSAKKLDKGLEKMEKKWGKREFLTKIRTTITPQQQTAI